MWLDQKPFYIRERILLFLHRKLGINWIGCNMDALMIVKRNGQVSNFDSIRIKNAIKKAITASQANVPEEKIDQIVEDINTEIRGRFHDFFPNVENVQDIVEKHLVKSDLYDVAKSYIIYRAERSKEREKEGAVWQTDLSDKFACECGKTAYTLEYVKESLHGMLLQDFSREGTGLSYIRRYAHAQIVKIVNEFTQLISSERLEQPVQTFIEQYPILLSRFHAKRMFTKPKIVGRYEADFAVVNSQNNLCLIELERPSLQLFKKDGHLDLKSGFTNGRLHIIGNRIPAHPRGGFG